MWIATLTTANPERGSEPPFCKQRTEDDLDQLVLQQFERHPRLVSTAMALTEYGDWGYTLIRATDPWQQDWDNISNVPRACKWHPPEVPPNERIRNAHIRALAISASHRWPNIFRDPIARLQFIGQQMDEGASGHSGLVGPCSWCGTFTGLWCDGVEATPSSIGWNCRVPVCSWCRSVFSECRRCSVHTGIPLQMDPGLLSKSVGSDPTSAQDAYWSSWRFATQRRRRASGISSGPLKAQFTYGLLASPHMEASTFLTSTSATTW